MTQHRLSRVQLVNWGTFSGYWGFQVPWRGMLLTGPSGAGKSSLLDAMAAILVRPNRLRLNAAAQGTDTGDQGRSLLTYVRGAHKREADADTGEIGTAFLRKGPTWSGVALTYTDAQAHHTTLIRLFHISGTSTDGSELKSMYVIAPGDVELLELSPFAENGLDFRKLKAAFPAWDAFKSGAYTGFAERFRRRLGMGSEQAQILLHKTQSAKNLTNLDSLFRDFMLDVPETFKLADQTVAQFDELRAAHSSVVDARRQVERLHPLRGWAEEREVLARQRDSVRAQQDHLETWLQTRQLNQLSQDIEAARPALARLEAETKLATDEVTAADEHRRRCQQALDQSGGADIEIQERLRSLLQKDRDSMEAVKAAWGEHAASLGLRLPAEIGEVPDFEQAVETAKLAHEAAAREHRKDQNEVVLARTELGREETRLAKDLAALRQHRSNLDRRLLDLRSDLAVVLQTSEANLPFVGELLQVRAEEAPWTGAIERVLGAFGRTLLVPDQFYRATAEYIDQRHLGARLVYEHLAVSAEDQEWGEAVAGTLPTKLEIADGAWQSWLFGQLVRRFSYHCVDSTDQFSSYERAVTRRGQVKHSTTRHEKDDRSQITDRSRWVLGFSTQEKEKTLEQLLSQLQINVADVEAQLQALAERGHELARRDGAIAALVGYAWEAVDTAEADRQLAAVAQSLAQLREANVDLRQRESDLKIAEEAYRSAEAVRRGLVADRDQRHRDLQRAETEVARLKECLDEALPVPGDIVDALEALLLDETGADQERALRDRLRRDGDKIGAQLHTNASRIERLMVSYANEWPDAAADWGRSCDDLPEYLARLDGLVSDRLPEFEGRFFTLLATQARQNVGQLAALISSSKREVKARVDEVNKSLRLTPFTADGYLQIKVLERQLPDVEEFLRTLRMINESSLLDVEAGDSAEERAAAEARFGAMEGLLQKLGSADPGLQRWRTRCLDTRQHVAFQAQVVDEQGRQQDVFTGSGGRSGGERQKLVTFCLAAALRFQLAPEGALEPGYALVVIDEAFDKADHTFTQAGLEVFKTFGFQLLLATPMKMLQTIEEYVGGVVMVSNVAGRGSALQELHYDLSLPQEEDAQKAEQDALL